MEERERERERGGQEGTSGESGVALRAAIHQAVEGGMIKRAWRARFAAPPLTASATQTPPPWGASTAYGDLASDFVLVLGLLRRHQRARPPQAVGHAAEGVEVRSTETPSERGSAPRGKRGAGPFRICLRAFCRGGRIARFRPAGCLLSTRCCWGRCFWCRPRRGRRSFSCLSPQPHPTPHPHLLGLQRARAHGPLRGPVSPLGAPAA